MSTRTSEHFFFFFWFSYQYNINLQSLSGIGQMLSISLEKLKAHALKQIDMKCLPGVFVNTASRCRSPASPFLFIYFFFKWDF